jgi:prefoldin subunit 5
MSRSARIESIEALKELRTFLCNFGRKISVALEDADFDIRRTLDWLKNDRHVYWKKEMRIRSEQLVRAKLELKRKQYFEQSPGHYFADEKKAVAAAQRRFDEAEDKLKKVRSWIPRLEKESKTCHGSLQGLSNLVQIELPNRRTQIDGMICALESYVHLAAPIPAGADVSVKADADDGIAALAKAVDDIQSASTDMEQLCRELRQRHPVKDLPLEIGAEKPLLNQFEHLTVSDEVLEIVKENKKDTSFFCEDDKLAFDRSMENCDFIYLEHLTAAGDTEIKWYAGRVEADATAGCSACRLSNFLKSYPALEGILSLPEGWLVVLKKNSVQAVFNSDDKLVGPTPSGQAV